MFRGVLCRVFFVWYTSRKFIGRGDHEIFYYKLKFVLSPYVYNSFVWSEGNFHGVIKHRNPNISSLMYTGDVVNHPSHKERLNFSGVRQVVLVVPLFKDKPKKSLENDTLTISPRFLEISSTVYQKSRTYFWRKESPMKVSLLYTINRS